MLNCIVIHGRLTRDASLKNTNGGSIVTSFSIACDRFSNGNKTTDFFDVVAWNNTATFISNHFKKGDNIIITGRLQTRSWTTETGENRKTTEILVLNVEFAGGNNKANEPTAATTAEPTAAAATTAEPPTVAAEPEPAGNLPFEI